MNVTTRSPLEALVQQGLEAVSAQPGARGLAQASNTPSETVEHVAAGLLAAMGYHEIGADFDLRAVAILGAACITGLQAFAEMEPGVHDPEAAIAALADLLRRTAPVEAAR